MINMVMLVPILIMELARSGGGFGGGFGGFSGGGFGGFEDIFDSFFGGGGRTVDPLPLVKERIYNIL